MDERRDADHHLHDAHRCPRCGHAMVHLLAWRGWLRSLAPWARDDRVACGMLIGAGRACPCRARFHAR